MHISRLKFDTKMTDERFVVMIPKMVAMIGWTLTVVSLAVILGFTFFSSELPHLIFYICFGLFIWLGMYLVLKTTRFKVVVTGESITVFPTFGASYSFTFDEITSAVRQVKRNQVKSERIVIKTVNGKKLIVESAEISYKRFAKRIQSEVENKYLFGFDA